MIRWAIRQETWQQILRYQFITPLTLVIKLKNPQKTHFIFLLCHIIYYTFDKNSKLIFNFNHRDVAGTTAGTVKLFRGISIHLICSSFMSAGKLWKI